MKRHPSLVPLSRDHHAALLLARLLQKGAPAYKTLPADIPGKAAYALKFYHDELIDHFVAEEKVLAGPVKGISPALGKLADEISSEHAQLRILFEGIPLSGNLETHLDSLGIALEKHIRKEERELFPLIQDSCSEEVLTKILQLLT